MFNRLKVALIATLFVGFHGLTAWETIADYHSDITLQKDGLLDITETITVNAEGHRIKNGITREFRTIYRPRILKSRVSFDVKKISRDGKELPIDDIENIAGGKRVYMRGGGRLKVPGRYVFTLRYTTNRQVSFLDDHDELYFNIVGADWIFPIFKVSATVHFPKNIDLTDIKITGFTGESGSQESAFTSQKVAPHTIKFTTTKPLNSYEAFTVAIWMPKGSITPPTLFQSWLWFFSDNLDIFLFILFVILLLAYILFHYRAMKRDQPESHIIPLFEPPKGFTPGMISYFIKRAFVPAALSADIVQMAVSGWITIDHKEGGWFTSQKYTLNRTDKSCNTAYYACILQKLFGRSKSVRLDRSNREAVAATVKAQDKSLKKTVKDKFFDNHFWFVFKVIIGGFLSAGLIFLFSVSYDAYPISGFFFLIFCIPVFIITGVMFQSYTTEGFSIRDQIEGFKLYLSVAESGRLKYTSTPPVKTPQLYEKFLPYAIALGVEEEWTAKFTPVFEKLIAQGKPYHSHWYIGHGRFRANNFASGSGSAFASAIGSSLASSIGASAPGSGSGFGGGGGAGGGGGGGGGGGC